MTISQQHFMVGFFVTGVLMLLSACTPAIPAQPSLTLTVTASLTVTITPSRTPEPTATPTPTPTPTPTITPAASDTPSPTPLPTYAVLRGKVTIAQAVCHYGPGAPYLYKYGVYAGNTLEIIRRVEGGNYVEIRAIGGSNPCWLRADYMDVRGDLNALQPVHPFDVKLPISPYYPPLPWAKAARSGDQITVTFSGLALRAGDEQGMAPYIVEAWLCQAGRMVFLPVGAYQTEVVVTDEAGCGSPSRIRVTAAEKHGYTRPIEVALPPRE
ncbi:MAG: hypothetical protein AB1453_08860 [Chloroflexota bacterium]|jgi:hypothetical protein